MDGLQMSGWSVPKLGAARINAACVLCIVLVGSLSLLLPGFIFFNLSNLTLKVWLANLAFAVQGNPTLHTFCSTFTQLLFDVLFAFCCASSKGHWYSMGQGDLLTHRINSLGVFTVSALGCQISPWQPVQQKTLPSKGPGKWGPGGILGRAKSH